jgi:hypothetical protein
VFPANDDWNRDISQLPRDDAWTERLLDFAGDVNLHPDYGPAETGLYGIPFNIVPEAQPAVPMHWDWFPEESDPGPFPFPGPDSIQIEGGSPTSCDGDCHVLVVQQGTCELFEGYACEHRDAAWHCGNGARWDLKRVAYGQRPPGYTSADAAGLPILPGLIRHDEVRAGKLTHATRFTLACTTNRYVRPASHFAVPDDCSPEGMLPMGARVRLRADFDLSPFTASARTVLQAFKTYGLILADNGSNFYFQGEAHPGWTEDDIEPLKDVPASAFEVVEMPPLEP